MNEKEKLIHDINKTILMLEGPYKWLDSKCYWLALFFGDGISQKIHVWHCRLQLKASVWWRKIRGV